MAVLEVRLYGDLGPAAPGGAGPRGDARDRRLAATT